MVKIKVKVKPQGGKSGTVIARVPVAVRKTDEPQGKRLFSTRAQLHTRIFTNKDGQARRD